MHKPFDIFYFDGQSTRSQTGRLWLRVDAWEIQLFGDDEKTVAKTVRWPLDGIHRNEAASGNNTFRFGDFPFQTLECRDSDFPKAVVDYYPEAGFLNRNQIWISRNKTLAAVLMTVGLLSIIGAMYFFVLPSAAEKLAEKVPISYEIQLGEKIAEGLTQNETVDSARSVLLQKFADEVDFGTKYDLKFTVIQKDEVNAFAAPGGRIFVYSHLLEKLESPEALVGLLAHESAHVSKRHALKGMARQLSGYLFVSAMLGDVSGLTTVLLENANMMNGLRFSRNLEREADETAHATLAANRLDQKGMVELFEALNEKSEAEKSTTLKFLSSHPMTEERLENARKRVETQGETAKNERLEAAFLDLNR